MQNVRKLFDKRLSTSSPTNSFEDADRRLADFEKALQAKAEPAKSDNTSDAAPKEADKSK